MSDDTSQAARNARINEYLGDPRPTPAEVQTDQDRIRAILPFNANAVGRDIIKKKGDVFLCFSDTVTPGLTGTVYGGSRIALQVIIGVIQGEENAIRACYRHARDTLTPTDYSRMAGPYSFQPYDWFMLVTGFDHNVGPHMIRVGFRRACQLEIEPAGGKTGGKTEGSEGPERKERKTGAEAPGDIDSGLESACRAMIA